MLDLAGRAGFAVSFLDQANSAGFDLRVTRTVLAELHALSRYGTDRQQELALRAMRGIITWHITPVLLTDL